MFFYCSHKSLYDKKKYTKEDKVFLKAFKETTKEEWETIQEVEALSISVTKFSMFEAQISCIIYPWIKYMRKKFHELIRKEFVQVLIYR